MDEINRFPVKRAVLAASLLAVFILGAGSNMTVFSKDPEKRFTSFLSYGGSSNSLGEVHKLDFSVGRKFSKHFEVDAGLPVYFVRASDTSSSTGYGSKNGIGNVYVDLRFSVSALVAKFSSTLRGAAPTGNTEQGFSTGRATIDWTNYLEGSLGPLTPFGSLGFANTVSDTHFFMRPFSSLGFVTHVEGGANYHVLPFISAGASVYAVAPNGQQKVFSKVIKRLAASATGSTPGRGKAVGYNRVFGTQSLTVGDAEIARDHGVSFWVDFNPHRALFFELGYSRSVRYAFDTVFFSVGLNLHSLARSSRQP